MTPTTKRDLALLLAERQLNEPYIWGGDDPLRGFDCSGLMNEVLKAAGVLPREGDWTAEQLAGKFPRVNEAALKPGCLLFWNRGTKIGHVEMVYAIIGGTIFTIGASGGGYTTTSPEEAAKQNAFVKVRPAVTNWATAVDPF